MKREGLSDVEAALELRLIAWQKASLSVIERNIALTKSLILQGGVTA